MAKQTSAGTTLAIAVGKPATEDKAGYEAMTWIPVGEVIDLPEYGPTVTVVESNPLEKAVTEKYPGQTDHGSIAIGLDQDMEDLGQIALQDSVQLLGKVKPHSYRIGFSNDKNDYFHGGTFSFTTAPGSANSMVGATAQVEINSVIIREDAPTP